MKYVFLYLVGDMLFYMGLKVLRDDFRYWVPIGGIVGLVVSCIARFIIKVVSDFTGCIQFRHPHEVRPREQSVSGANMSDGRI